MEPQSNDPRRQADPRVKVYDDAATAPFLAKDVDKFWKPENAEYVAKVASFIDEYAGEWTVPAFEKALEDYIRGNEWPMGKVMNATRLALARCRQRPRNRRHNRPHRQARDPRPNRLRHQPSGVSIDFPLNEGRFVIYSLN